MAKKSGNSVEWKGTNGETIQGVAYHEDQKQGFRERGLIVCRETDYKGDVKKLNGKEVVKMVDRDKVKVTGFIN